ncbi:hypothetical protein B0T11DRAFT_275055 [Plectosphaerella cucumerina]|uniref:Nucleotide-diphospho-sugar transferase domain-containing protein n=1 Tax=Plectosphaerella cucumerina TaxID=40658 RepID=A0A8K0TGU7_9PEZI|nr:hypothetical protein B0T11DRAFT_275055 [Plectosphaerella cucumerina]
MKHMVLPRIPLNSTVYKPHGAYQWEIKEDQDLLWETPLNKQLCIFDLDNRPFEEEGQIFGPKTLSWTDNPVDMHGLSLGVLQHWLYAKIHGYKYYYVHTGEFEDRRASWKKPSVMGRILKKHQTCVYMDSDAIFNHMDLPLEWLMNYWNIDKNNNSVALAMDPKAEHNVDKQGKLYDNTGFMIVQNRPVTFEMMDDWAVCADEGGKHPDCVEYRTVAFGRPSDQGGFGNFIRYDYKDHVKELPCAEANGFPEDRSECLGTFIKHLWSGKNELIKIAIGEQLPGKFLEIFHRQMMKEKDSFYLTEERLMSDAWLKERVQ